MMADPVPSTPIPAFQAHDNPHDLMSPGFDAYARRHPRAPRTHAAPPAPPQRRRYGSRVAAIRALARKQAEAADREAKAAEEKRVEQERQRAARVPVRSRRPSRVPAALPGGQFPIRNVPPIDPRVVAALEDVGPRYSEDDESYESPGDRPPLIPLAFVPAPAVPFEFDGGPPAVAAPSRLPRRRGSNVAPLPPEFYGHRRLGDPALPPAGEYGEDKEAADEEVGNYDDGQGFLFHFTRGSHLPWIALNGLRPMVLGIFAGTHYGHDFRPAIFAYHTADPSEQKELDEEIGGEDVVALRFEPEGDFVDDESAKTVNRSMWITDEGFVDPSNLHREGHGALGPAFTAPEGAEGHTFVAKVPESASGEYDILPLVEAALFKHFHVPAHAKLFSDEETMRLHDLPKMMLIPTYVDFKADPGWGEPLSEAEEKALLDHLGDDFGWGEDGDLRTRRREYPDVVVKREGSVIWIAPIARAYTYGATTMVAGAKHYR